MQMNSANESTSLKNDMKIIVAPFIYAKQRWLLSSGIPKEDPPLFQSA